MRYAFPSGDQVFLKEGGLISNLPAGSVTKFNPDFETLLVLPAYHVKIVGDEALEKIAGEKDTADASRLATFKTQRASQIRANTEAVIERDGFAFDGQTFPITSLYRDMFLALREAVLASTISLPQDIPTIDGNKYSLTAVNGTNFFNAFLTALKTYVADENQLLSDVNAASTKAELDAVVDSR